MARLIYSAIMSLDGYTADADGRFEWAAPDEEVHAFVNELERPVGTYLYGRRMYETMRYWETAHTLAGQPPVGLDFARIWQAADKIVYSTTLQAPATARTRIERAFDPVQVRKLKEAACRDLTVGGARLAAQAIAAGLVDEYQLFVVPAVVGGGTRALPDRVPPEPGPGRGAQVRQRHRLPLLPPGLVGRRAYRIALRGGGATAEQAFVEPQADEAGGHAGDWYQHQSLPMQRAQHEQAERRPSRRKPWNPQQASVVVTTRTSAFPNGPWCLLPMTSHHRRFRAPP